jgi:dinuclear metal center YbgI/SA1388 family protein
LTELVHYLDEYLRVAEVPDYPGAHNGLQVEGKAAVQKLAAAVDACIATIEEAVRLEADMLLVHHGLLWGEARPFVGPLYRRLKPAFDSGLTVYSSHLPLDAHPEVGNNHQLARVLGLAIADSFGRYENYPIGVRCSADVARQELAERLDTVLGSPCKVLACGPLRARRIGIVTGGGAGMVPEAAEAELDTLITGEVQHHTFLAAEDCGINVILAGHYATEVFGVRALARHLGEKFGLDWALIEHPSGL